MRRFTSLWVLALAILLAACAPTAPAPDAPSGGEEDPTTMTDTDTQPDDDAPPPTREGDPDRLPRPDRATVAGREVGEGIDFCDQYETPEPEPFVPEDNLGREVREGDRTLGDADAPVTMVFWGDLTCSTCAQIWENMRGVHEDRPEQTVLVYRTLANTNDELSLISAQTLEEAAAQGGDDAYYAAVDLLYEEQVTWDQRPEEEVIALFVGYFEDDLGLDGEALREALEDETHLEAVRSARQQALSAGVLLPPHVAVNAFTLNDASLQDEPILGSDIYMDAFVETSLLRITYPEGPEPVVERDKDYGAWIVTENGVIAADLFANLAPFTVNNFAYLACQGYYEGVTFHRVLPGFVAQGGDPTGLGIGNPGYTIPDEFQNSDLTFDGSPWLSMAKTLLPNSAGGQFFIMLGPAEQLDANFTIFGEVVEGDDVVAQIEQRDPAGPGVPPPGTTIENIIVRELD